MLLDESDGEVIIFTQTTNNLGLNPIEMSDRDGCGIEQSVIMVINSDL